MNLNTDYFSDRFVPEPIYGRDTEIELINQQLFLTKENSFWIHALPGNGKSMLFSNVLPKKYEPEKKPNSL